MKAEERLKDYLEKGIAFEITFVDRAYALAEEISQHAQQINKENFGELFGFLQQLLSDHQTLAVTKLFDPAGNKYATRSIPGTRVLLEKHAALWGMPGRCGLTEALVQGGKDASSLERLNNAELTHAVVNHFRDKLPAAGKLRQMRNKVIAHNEATQLQAQHMPTWGEALRLTNYAKDFLTTIWHGYLD